MAENPPMKNIFFWCGLLALGGTFAYAALQKILAPAAFAADIGHYHLLPHPLTLALGLYLPWLEIFCGIGILCRWRERGALILAAAMCAMFCVALSSAWFRGLDINCGCFGHGAASSDLPLAIARSAVLGLLALSLFTRSQSADKHL